MNVDRLIELAILLTLWIEFAYDAMWNNREAQAKRRQAKRKKPDFESLTTGEHR